MRKIMIIILAVLFVVVTTYGLFTWGDFYFHSEVFFEYRKTGMYFQFDGFQNKLTKVFNAVSLEPGEDISCSIFYGDKEFQIKDITREHLVSMAELMNCKLEKNEEEDILVYQGKDWNYKILYFTFIEKKLKRVFFQIRMADPSIQKDISEKIAFKINHIKFSLPLSEKEILSMFGIPEKKRRTYVWP